MDPLIHNTIQQHEKLALKSLDEKMKLINVLGKQQSGPL